MRLLSILLFLALSAATALAQATKIPITDLPTVFTPLTGSEVLPIVQSGVTRKSTTAQLATYFWTSPVFVTPNLGTPSSIVLTNATGLPISGISATGTPNATTYLRGDGVWAASAAAGPAGIITPGITQHLILGDSISVNSGSYSYGLVSDEGSIMKMRALATSGACDVADQQQFSLEPGDAPLVTLMDGTNDVIFRSTIPSYRTDFNACQKASIAWAAVPSASRIQAQNCTQAGTWVADSTYQGIGVQSTTNASTLTCSVSTFNGPIYVWYRIIIGNGGTFTYNLDGSGAVSVNAFPVSAVVTFPRGSTKGVGVLRIPASANATHSIVFTVTSSTGAGNIVPIMAVGTPPSSSLAAPRVFVAGMPFLGSEADPSVSAGYYADTLANQQLFAGDGLNVNFVDTRSLINGTTDLADGVHPTPAGYQKLRVGHVAAERFVTAANAPLSAAIGNFGIGGGGLSYNNQSSLNTAVGYGALAATTSGGFNTATGAQSLYQNTVGSLNAGFGEGSLAGNVNGNYNTALGTGALTQANNSNNTAAGANAGYDLLSGGSNSCFGKYACKGISTGSNNTIMGATGTSLPSGLTGAIVLETGDGVIWEDYNKSMSGGWTLAGGIAHPVPLTKTANYTVLDADYSLIFNGAGSLTVTLPSAASYVGRILKLKTIAAQTVVSASSNVSPLTSATPGTAILAATAGKWAELQSDGTNWIAIGGN